MKPETESEKREPII